MLEVPKRLDEIRALERLTKLGRELVEKEVEYGQKQRPIAAALSDELGLPLRTIRRWLEEGRVSGPGYRRFRQRERERKAEAAEDKLNRRRFQELMKAGRRPFTIVKKERYWDEKKAKHVVKVTKTQAPVVPVFRPSEGYYGGDMTSGYRWSIAVRDYLSPALIGKLAMEARAVPRDAFKKRMRRKLPEWSVFVVVSFLYREDGDRGHPVEAHSGSRYKYGDLVRNDLAEEFDEARRFVVKESFTSGNWSSLEAAVAEFQVRLLKLAAAGHLVWVHGLVVWNFRRRSAEEWAGIVERRRIEAEQRRAKKKATKKTKTAKRLRSKGRAARAEYEARLKKKKG